MDAKKQKFKDAVEVWHSRYRLHKMDTRNFAFALHTLTRDELTTINQVTPEWVAWAPVVLQTTVLPAVHPLYRRNIAYLTELHERQIVAWQETVASWEDEREELVAHFEKLPPEAQDNLIAWQERQTMQKLFTP